MVAIDEPCPSDTDGDGWADDDEGVIGTDPLDDCTDQAGDEDAWPPDIDRSAEVGILDVLLYKPVLKGSYDSRYDLDAGGEVDILDVLLYKPVLGERCGNP